MALISVLDNLIIKRNILYIVLIHILDVNLAASFHSSQALKAMAK